MNSPPLTPIDFIYKFPAFSASKASTLHVEKNLSKMEIFQNDQRKWVTFEQRAEEMLEQDILKPSIIFASSKTFETNQQLKEKLCRQYDIPYSFWTKSSYKASGYFGYYDYTDEAGKVLGCNTWLRFIIKMTKATSIQNNTSPSYHWEKIKVFTKFEASKNDILLCFDTPPSFKEALKEAVTNQYLNSEMTDPFLLPSILIGEVVSLFDTSVWSLRDLVRSVERTRAYTERPEPDYYQFHEISRHVIHSTETITLAVKTLDSMIEQHKSYLQDAPAHAGNARAMGRRVHQSLLYQKSLIQCLKGRSEALGLRLQNEINLAFNTVSQYDSKLAVKVGQAAQADSASMRAIAILTFIFLPGTFISSILGMDFFNFSPGDSDTPSNWVVSDKLWIFFALTIPLTIITGVLWYFWQRRYGVGQIRSAGIEK